MLPTRGASLNARVNRRGTAAVELAVVLPVMMLLVLGCIDLGRAVSVHIVLSNAARTAAEYGATHRFTSFTRGAWESQVLQEGQAEMQSAHDFDGSRFSMTVQTVPDPEGFVRVTVTAEYPFKTITQWPGLPHEIPIERSVVARQFR